MEGIGSILEDIADSEVQEIFAAHPRDLAESFSQVTGKPLYCEEFYDLQRVKGGWACCQEFYDFAMIGWLRCGPMGGVPGVRAFLNPRRPDGVQGKDFLSEPWKVCPWCGSGALYFREVCADHHTPELHRTPFPRWTPEKED